MKSGTVFTNPLLAALGSPPSTQAISKRLWNLSPLPGVEANAPLSQRLVEMQSIRQLFVPSPDNIRVATTVDCLLRHGYTIRDPSRAQTWRASYESVADQQRAAKSIHPLEGSALMASLFGVSGTGKSRTVTNACAAYPNVVLHRTFPLLVGPFKQLVHLKADVPESGKLVDFVTGLMERTDELLETGRFEKDLALAKKSAIPLMRKWMQVAKSHFLGLLVIDEIQNLFQIPRLKERRSGARSNEPMVTVRDDELLKCILTLSNAAAIPILVAGTPDGLAALKARLSTAERATTGGYHSLLPSLDKNDKYFREFVLPQLMARQWTKTPSTDGLGIGDALHKFSAGVPRIYVGLWIQAQRVCVERGGATVVLEDIKMAAQTYMAPLQQAVQALLSGNVDALRRYEDIVSAPGFAWGC